MPHYKVVRHPSVRRDLFKLVELVAQYAGYEVAERKLVEIEATIDTLRHTPHIGTLRNEILSGLRAIPVADKGVLCFIVDDESLTVSIICIAYAGSNWALDVTDR